MVAFYNSFEYVPAFVNYRFALFLVGHFRDNSFNDRIENLQHMLIQRFSILFCEFQDELKIGWLVDKGNLLHQILDDIPDHRGQSVS